MDRLKFEICLWEIKKRGNIMVGRTGRRGRGERRGSGCWGNGEEEKRKWDETGKDSSDLIEFCGSCS